MSRPVRLTIPLALATLLVTLLATLLVATPVPSVAAPVEELAHHDPQRTCAASAGPGTTYLLGWLTRTYGGRPGGTLRDCASGGASEHKDGRALDWSLDARDARDRTAATRFLTALAAPDARGNVAALGRRMGVMYVIWDDRIYSSHRGFRAAPYVHAACPRRKGCSPTLRHRDHVHISLSRAGAAAQTSFFRARGVPRVPVLVPGTHRLDPVATAVHTVEVRPGSSVRTPFRVQRGTTYRLVAEGRYRYGAGARVADAACVWSAGRWAPQSAGLQLNGTSPWVAGPADGGADGTPDCTSARGDGVHEVLWKPRRSGPVTLTLGRGGRAASGAVRLHFVAAHLPAATAATSLGRGAPAYRPAPRPAARPGPGARRLRTETVALPARAATGVRTTRALRRGQRYRVVVTGVAERGGITYDGACVRYAGRMRPQHSLDLTRPDADHFALHVHGVAVPLRPRGTTGAGSCSATHTYVGTFRAPVRGRARVRVWDPRTAPQAAAGALSVRITAVGRIRQQQRGTSAL